MMVQNVAFYIVTPLLSAAVIFAFIRLVRGPSLPDRVVALDLMTTVGIGAIAVYAIAMKEPILLDVAIVLALVSFLGVIGFAYYVAKAGQEQDAGS